MIVEIGGHQLAVDAGVFVRGAGTEGDAAPTAARIVEAEEALAEGHVGGVPAEEDSAGRGRAVEDEESEVASIPAAAGQVAGTSDAEGVFTHDGAGVAGAGGVAEEGFDTAGFSVSADAVIGGGDVRPETGTASVDHCATADIRETVCADEGEMEGGGSEVVVLGIAGGVDLAGGGVDDGVVGGKRVLCRVGN